MDFYIGPRMVKTGFAVTLTLLLVNYFNLDLPLVAAIAAVLAMQPSIMRSFNYIKEVSFSNTIAVVFALGGTYFLGYDPLSIGIIVIVAIALTVKMGWTNTTNLTVLTILALTLFGSDFNFMYVAERVSLIAIGVGSSFIINAVMFPPKHQKILFEMIKEANDKTTHILRVIPNKKMVMPELKKEEKDIEIKLSKISDYYKIIADERKRMFIKDKKGFLRDIVIYRQMLRVLKKKNILITDLEKRIIEIEKLSPEKSHLIKKMIDEIIHYNENIMMMYEGKIILNENLQKESKAAMRVTINNLIMELQNSEMGKWIQVFPVANGIIDLFFELDRLERLVRVNAKKNLQKGK